MKLVCPKCKANNDFIPSDLKWEYDGWDKGPVLEYYVVCPVCGKDYGDNNTLELLIEDLPDGPQND